MSPLYAGGQLKCAVRSFAHFLSSHSLFRSHYLPLSFSFCHFLPLILSITLSLSPFLSLSHPLCRSLPLSFFLCRSLLLILSVVPSRSLSQAFCPPLILSLWLRYRLQERATDLSLRHDFLLEMAVPDRRLYLILPWGRMDASPRLASPGGFPEKKPLRFLLHVSYPSHPRSPTAAAASSLFLFFLFLFLLIMTDRRRRARTPQEERVCSSSST